MDIVVCVKQVPDTNEVKIDPEEGTLIREGVPSIINPEDRHGIEEAIKLKEEYGGKVTVISMGPPQAEEVLKEALAMGVDEAILVSDRAFAGSDTWVTAYTITEAIKNLDGFDLIFCGRQAIDGDTAQVGPQIAENLGIPQVTYATDLNIEGKEVEVKRQLEDGYSIIETELPLLVTVLDDINDPRYPSIKGIVDAYRKQEIEVWGADDLKLDESRLGLDASPTKVHKTFVPTHEKKGEILEGDPKEQAKELINKLKEEKVV
ncbi:electron transfer flavoprotein subunit beta/FixA family protein [Sporohalobacter salinus]|uniref:electron transfer flavoprotein subunit beta/FixA family protein n=1 Tax=Sporohalobacter salinus TaxID=1494606 RepID=UPI00196156D4|nr:electron transfer flavoprotein subunit beta/FixA family protein [Sporohalobacter salinus]MBM7622642.1 electron transfer flavoprotein beta subunit [Sporohalobacter salinus]